MGLVELLLIAVGLSMDAFAVSICKGLGMKKVNLKVAVVLALFFGGFQALMPLIGWALGSQFLGSGRPSTRTQAKATASPPTASTWESSSSWPLPRPSTPLRWESPSRRSPWTSCLPWR